MVSLDFSISPRFLVSLDFSLDFPRFPATRHVQPHQLKICPTFRDVLALAGDSGRLGSGCAEDKPELSSQGAKGRTAKSKLSNGWLPRKTSFSRGSSGFIALK